MAPTVSVIIASYNSKDYISTAIQSVLTQTYQDFEVIIVDDQSTDNTLSVVHSLNDERIHVYCNEDNSGPGFSRNRAIELSGGQWIAVLDSDDWWHPSRLERLLQSAVTSKSDIVFDDLYLIRDGENEPYDTYLHRAKLDYKSDTPIDTESVISNDFGYLKPMFKRSFLTQNDLKYWTKSRCGEDFIFLLRCMVHNAMACIHPHPLYYYRQRGGSLSVINSPAKIIEQLSQQIDDVNNLMLEIPLEYSSVVPHLLQYIVEKEKRLERQKQHYSFYYELSNHRPIRAVKYISTDILKDLIKGGIRKITQ